MALDVVRLASLSPVSMFASKVYFSLTEILDPAHHRTHNEWHQLDHRPENLLLPGVAWGDRWVRSPDCAQASAGLAPEYARTHYAIMYWFREPLRAAISRQWWMVRQRWLTVLSVAERRSFTATDGGP